MPINDELRRLVDRCGVQQDMVTWLESVGVTAPEDVGVLAATEDKVTSQILQAAQETEPKVPLATGPQYRIQVTKLWLACRLLMTERDRDSTSDDSLPGSVATAIKTRWSSVHNFELIGDMLVVPSLLKKMWAPLSSNPRAVLVVHAENIKVHSATADKDSIQELRRTAEGEARFKEVLLDEIKGHFDLYRRVRAYLWSTAYLCIEFRSWFSFQDALYVSERVLFHINATHQERRPPVAHFVQAWASTLSKWSDSIRTTNVTLNEATKQSAQWEHFWTMYASGNHNEPQGLLAIQDADPDVRSKLDKTKEDLRRMQSEKDKAVNAVAALKRKGQATPRGKGGGQGGRPPLQRRR